MEPQPQDEDSVVLSFRLPNSHRLDHVFPRSATTKVINNVSKLYYYFSFLFPYNIIQLYRLEYSLE